MLRVTQMALCQALIYHRMGRDWRFEASVDCGGGEELSEYQRVVSLFMDRPSAALSLHNLVRAGLTLGKRPSDWFGPTSGAQAACAMLSHHAGTVGLRGVVFDDGVVYREEVGATLGGVK